MSKKQKFIQKTSFIFIVILLTMISFFTYIICKEGNKEINYYIVNNNKNSTYISEIYINDKVVELSKQKNYDDKNSKVIIEDNYNISIKQLDKLSIKFENVKDITIYKNNKKIKYNLEENFEDISSLRSIIYNYFKVSRNKIFINVITPLIILLFINYYCVYIIYKIINKLSKKTIKLFDIVKFFVSIFLIFLQIYYICQYFLKNFIILIILSLIFLLILKQKKILYSKIEYMYFIFATILGITFIFMLPPLHVPDEGAHYIKTFESSDFITRSKLKLEYDQYGHTFVYLPKTVDEFYNFYNSKTLIYNTKYSEREYLSHYYENLSINNISKAETFYAVANSSILAYIPSIVTMSILKVFSLSPLLLQLFARATNLLIGIILIYTAIKIAPKYKNIIFLISLLPITIQSGIGINQDWLNNALFMLILSLIIKINNDKSIMNKDIFTIGLLTVFLSLCKIVYIPIILLLLLLPKEKFKSKKNMILIKYVIPLSVFVLSFGIYKIISYNPNAIKVVENNLYTMSDFFNNPTNGLYMIFNTLRSRLSLDLYRGMFDGFAWHTIWQIDLFRDIITILFLPLIYFSSKDEEKNKKNVWLIFAVAIVLCALIYAAMMFAWTKDYMDYIDGLQPRYFIPCLPLFYICLTNFFKCKNFNQKNYIYTYIGIIIIYLLSFITLMKGFY